MTRMLALVGSAADAAMAIDGGAAGIVVRASLTTHLPAIAAAVSGRCPVTVWLDGPTGSDWVPDLAATLRDCRIDSLWGEAVGTPLPVPHWAVVTRADTAAVALAAARGRAGIVIAGNGSGRLLATTSIAELERLRQSVEAHGLRFGIAGGMEAPDVPRLLAFMPDCLLGDDLVRDGPSPHGPIVPEKLRVFLEIIEGCAPLAGIARPTPVPFEPDRIFVRDWIVPLHVGAYAHEREAQRVRFTVEVEVAPSPGRTTDMRDVVTYDLILDAIARVTIAHVPLVETIAEDVARLIFGHPRVSGVDVTVEKLDLGPGALGCRIGRRRLL